MTTDQLNEMKWLLEEEAPYPVLYDAMIAFVPAAIARIEELEAKNARLRKENDSLSFYFQKF